MRLLRIKFNNLNSLPSGDIDLEHGPLASAGIFAITGPTGAGKSTLLDAITLALYGRATRYDREPNPENMMSRHTGECLAEVLFEVPRGRFIARWELRRARGKAEGRLQSAKRTIIEEGTGAVLAEKIDEVDRWIEELTGLDYERFRRSVLLAQGEFARFLKAKPDERAELLESLTGTSVYSSLSELAYREATARREELTARQEALGRIVLFTEEERAAKTAEVERWAGEVERLNARRGIVGGQIEKGRQLLERLSEEAGLLDQQRQLAEATAEAEASLQRLQGHRLAQPFAAHLRVWDAMVQQETAEAAQSESAQTAATEAGRNCAAGLHAAQTVFSRLIQASQNVLAQSEADIVTRKSELDSTARWLADHAADAALESALPEWVDRLHQLANGRAQSAILATEIAAFTPLLEAADQRAMAFAAELAQAEAAERAALAEVTKAKATLAGLLKGKSLEEVVAEGAPLSRKLATLLELRTAMEKRDAVAAEASRLADEEAALVEEIEFAQREKAASAQDAEAQAALLESARVNLELQERIAGMEDQRAQLKEGQPCPLCGAENHPFAQAGGPFSGAIEEARRNLKAARTANDSAASEARLAAEVLTRIEERLAGVRKRRGEIRWQQAADHEFFEKLARSVRIFTPDALAEAQAALEKARETQESLLASLRESERDSHAADKALLAQQGALARLRANGSAEQSARADLEARRVAKITERERVESELAAQTAALALALEPFGEGVPEAGAESATRERLEERRKRFTQELARRTRLENELARISQHLETQTRQREELGARARKFTLTGVHAPFDSELAARYESQWTTLEEVEAALQLQHSAWTEASAKAGERRSHWEELRKAVAVQAGEFAKRLAGSVFADAAALRAALLEDAEAARIEALQSGLETRAQALQGQLHQVRGQICALREAEGGVPEWDALAALEADRSALETQLAAATEQRVTLRNELALDDHERQGQAGQLAQLEAERGRFAVWDRLRAMIGSANGGVFRQFAQGLSLDLLVRHANRHLTRLSDRYRLRRVAGGELSLEIVDAHQAEATRPMQSLSGGESFLASLALALGLSDLAGRNVRIDSLFIDEGFGSLDSATLDLAVAALDSLRLTNKTVGVISHVELLKERIPVQIRVEKRSGGVSVLHMPTAA